MSDRDGRARGDADDARVVSTLSWRKKLLFSLLPLVFLVSATEIALRLLPDSHDDDETRAGLVVPDPDLIWRLAPTESGPLRTNALGLRDDPLDPDADLRILLLGDSVAWGDGVPRREAVFPQVAEQILDAAVPSMRIEIINSAVLGYSTFQQRRYLELKGLALEPEMLILQFCLNDVTERYRRLAAYGGGNRFLGVDTRRAIPGIFGWLVERSRLFETLARARIRWKRSREAYDVRNLAVDDPSPEIEEAWRDTLAEVDRIRDIARNRGMPLLIVISPYRFQLEDPAGLGQPQRRLVRHLETAGGDVLDLLPAFARFAKASGGADLLWDESHFTELGHHLAGRMTAEAVLRRLREDGRIP